MSMDPENDPREQGKLLVKELTRRKYAHPFTWLGRPIIQLPHDMFAMQEIIWKVQPDLIVETGIAHGGSLVFYASMLELLGAGQVLGIDVDIRAHNRVEIERHPLRKRILMLEGSSIDEAIARQVFEQARACRRVLMALDSNHTHAHVFKELELYAPLVRTGSYLVVFDTAIDDLPKEFFPDRPWGPGNNPKTAVHEFLRGTDRFVIDRDLESKLLMTVAPDGYLRCIKDPA
jgi:cephalosporin hydroxylase